MLVSVCQVKYMNFKPRFEICKGSFLDRVEKDNSWKPANPGSSRKQLLKKKCWW